MEGFVGIYRKMLKWEWYHDHTTKAVFLHLLLMASHEGGKWQGQTIQRGQLITGRKRLAKDLKLSERSIRTSLSKLKTTNELTIKATNKNSVITITNYEYYNPKDRLRDPKLTSKPTNDESNERPTSDQQVTTLKNVENEKNEEEITTGSSKKKKKTKTTATPARDNPPTKAEMGTYCQSKEMVKEYLDTTKFIDYYKVDSIDNDQWTDKYGNDVFNWKLTLGQWYKNQLRFAKITHEQAKEEIANRGSSCQIVPSGVEPDPILLACLENQRKIEEEKQLQYREEHKE